MSSHMETEVGGKGIPYNFQLPDVLNEDILRHVAKFLPWWDRLSLLCTNKFWCNLLRDGCFWQELDLVEEFCATGSLSALARISLPHLHTLRVNSPDFCLFQSSTCLRSLRLHAKRENRELQMNFAFSCLTSLTSLEAIGFYSPGACHTISSSPEPSITFSHKKKNQL